MPMAGSARSANGLTGRMGSLRHIDDCAQAGRGAVRKPGWNDRFIGMLGTVDTAGIKAIRWRIAGHCACDSNTIALADPERRWQGNGAASAKNGLWLHHRMRMDRFAGNAARQVRNGGD